MNYNLDAMFLAGDYVQAVREGVAFRFEEVRGIAHSLNQSTGVGADVKNFARPETLVQNYRSHSGILRVCVFVNFIRW